MPHGRGCLCLDDMERACQMHGALASRLPTFVGQTCRWIELYRACADAGSSRGPPGRTEKLADLQLFSFSILLCRAFVDSDTAAGDSLCSHQTDRNEDAEGRPQAAQQLQQCPQGGPQGPQGGPQASFGPVRGANSRGATSNSTRHCVHGCICSQARTPDRKGPP